MSPRIHPDIDPPDPAVRAVARAIHLRWGLRGNGHRQDPIDPKGYCGSCEEDARIAVGTGRPIWAHQIAIAVEDAASDRSNPAASEDWYAVAEFIRAREDQ